MFLDYTGFPYPGSLDALPEPPLDKLLCLCEDATYRIWAGPPPTIEVHGIQKHSLLLVDRLLAPAPEKAVIVIIEKRLTIRRFERWEGEMLVLKADTPAPSLVLPREALWATVTFIIRPEHPQAAARLASFVRSLK